MVVGAQLVLALKCRGRVVHLEEEAPPQQGNTVATGGRLAGFFLKGFCTVEFFREKSVRPAHSRHRAIFQKERTLAESRCQ